MACAEDYGFKPGTIPHGSDGEQGHPMQGEKAAEIWDAIQRFARSYGLQADRLGFLMMLLWSDGTFVGCQGWVNGEQARMSLQSAPMEFIRSDCGSRMVAIFPHLKVRGEMTKSSSSQPRWWWHESAGRYCCRACPSTGAWLTSLSMVPSPVNMLHCQRAGSSVIHCWHACWACLRAWP